MAAQPPTPDQTGSLPAAAEGIGLAELAARIGAQLTGDGGQRATGIAALDEAGPSEVAFFANARYQGELAQTRALAVIVGNDQAHLVPAGAARLVADPPYVAFAKASTLFHPVVRPPPGIHPRAVVEDGAQVDPTATIGALAYVGRGARIGARTVLHPGVVVLDEAIIGADCLLWPGAVVRERCVLGARVTLQPNAVVGADGFGFAFDPQGEQGPVHRKVPQAGIVRIEDDVELGAATCVDRATLGQTLIGRGTKIDNLVQVGHNVEVGPLCLIVAGVGIGGSTTLGAGVVLAGQVGVVGHVRIGDGARAAAKSGITNDVEPGATISGFPALDHKRWLRVSAATQRGPELVREVRALRERMARLEAALAEKKG